MTTNRGALTGFTSWVTDQLRAEPHAFVRLWIEQWGKVYDAMNAADGLYDVPPAVLARWEFLGGLYLGSTNGTGHAEAIAYSERFLEPDQPLYAPLHNMTGLGGASDLFTMLRSKPLHGMTPAPIVFPDLGGTKEVVTWWIVNGADSQHLQIDTGGALHVSTAFLVREFLDSMRAFADYLDRNDDLLGLLGAERQPRARFTRAFWACHKPRGFERDHSGLTWMQLGESLGIPK